MDALRCGTSPRSATQERSDRLILAGSQPSAATAEVPGSSYLSVSGNRLFPGLFLQEPTAPPTNHLNNETRPPPEPACYLPSRLAQGWKRLFARLSGRSATQDPGTRHPEPLQLHHHLDTDRAENQHHQPRIEANDTSQAFLVDRHSRYDAGEAGRGMGQWAHIWRASRSAFSASPTQPFP